ncbi:DEAD/DEAH box helicase [Paenibacillus beijingensis]|uniref:DEAD/DEAH box helicase n=1 Tax=Paenibacillus beijingensis TaxID=1126833 RepID=A0A0D5NI55_9BACL|nr:DEAD/DEAH box helicase [Paenibacillus beijingensis]AJY74637.1 DEAD/DEAH box helicase [Paenibacillus beijingensis]
MPSRNPVPFHPVLAGWFTGRFGAPTDVQSRAWQAIAAGSHTLIAAPTGSGKTLAALLPCLDKVLRAKLEAARQPGRKRGSAASAWKPGVRVLYITPLKALNNDIYEHIIGFVEEIARAAEAEAAGAGTADGTDWPGLTCAVRTGDTPQSRRAAMLRRPPDVLVTTPESLFIMLTSVKGRDMLQTVEHVIVDEIHDLAADKRGSHLSLSLERLGVRCERPPQRIGVSATQKPLSRVARFLGGWEEPGPNDAAPNPARSDAESEEPVHPLGYRARPVSIIESAMSKTMDISVTMPDNSRIARTRESVWYPVMDRLLQLMNGCRSVLVFVNSRRLCERLCLRLNDYVGYEMARAHHGSMDRGRRLEVEEMLKAGKLRCIVATSSLELGIDVGHVDLVVQIDSPQSAAAGIQRIGRAGHAVGDASRGVILARERGALAEIAVLSRLIAARDIEPIAVPRNALDVLSQQTVAMAAMDDWHVSGLHRLVARSDSYRDFPLPRLESMLNVLAGFYPFARPLLDWDRASGTVRARSNTAMASIVGAGTIPQSSAYPVHHADSRAHLGELDEEFVQESRVGDVFQLGTNSWIIRDIQKDRIYVSETADNLSEIPFWRNEAGGRSFGLGQALGKFWSELEAKLSIRAGEDTTAAEAGGAAETAGDRYGGDAPIRADGGSVTALRSGYSGGESAAPPRDSVAQPASGSDSPSGTGDSGGSADDDELDDPRDEAAIAWLGENYCLDRLAAGRLAAMARAQSRVSALPTDTRIVIEHYKDVTNQTHIILHNTFGRRVNRTWQLALERQLKQILPYKIYGNAKDNGIEFVMPEWDASWMQAIWQVTSTNLEKQLLEAVPGSPLLAIAFRRIAETSLQLSRSYTRTPMWQKRLRSEELLRAALPYADDFPYLQEAVRECLYDYLDLPHLRKVLQALEDGSIAVTVRETARPSPLAAQFVADYVNMRLYEGDGLDESMQRQLMSLSKDLATDLFGRDALRGAIAPEVLAAENERLGAVRQKPQSEDDLYRVLKERGDLSADELAKLTEDDGGGRTRRWLEELELQGRALVLPPAYGSLRRWICADERVMYEAFPDTAASAAFVMSRFIDNRLSFTEDDLIHRYPQLTPDTARQLVDGLLDQGRIQQAPFADNESERIWTGSGIARRIVRLSVQAARSGAHPASAIRWCGQIALRQHALAGTQLRGTGGLRAVIGTLQGFFFPLSHWESVLFPARITDYRKEELDLLCASGEVIWIGRKADGDKEGRIAFFLAESKALYAPYLPNEPSGPGAAEVTKHPQLLARLRESGAIFLTRLAREAGRLPSEVLADLLDLVWEGHASNDQFAPLRLWAAAKGKNRAKTGSGLGRWYWTGSLAEGDEDGSGSANASGSANGRADASGSAEPPAVRWARHLLDTYGIVTKELVAAATPYSWDSMLPVLKRLEEWGVLTRGLFMEGMASMQFTTRELADAVRKPLPGGDSGLTLLSAVDPANPFGLLTDWPQMQGAAFARKPGNYMVLQDGQWLYWIENNGRRVRVMNGAAAGASADGLKIALRTILRQQGLTKISVERWNGDDVTDSEGAEVLRALGAERDRSSLVLWSSQLG